MGATKSRDYERNTQFPKMNRAGGEIDLTACSARVDKVHIAGLQRTHDNYVQRATKGLFTATNFQDVIVECSNARSNLIELGIFKDLQVRIDISKGENASPNGYAVTFSGTELPRVVGTVGTEVGQNEGSMTIELSTPNLWGRGERVSLHGSYSNIKTADLTLRLSKPFLHSHVFGDYKPEISLALFRHATSVPISSYKTHNIGLIGEFRCLLPYACPISHSLQYEVSFREITALGKQSPFFVSEQSGPRMASLIRHIASYDQRDSLIFPTRGFHVKCTSEFSGLGGNIAYVMGSIHAEVSLPLFAGISAQMVSRVGVIKNIGRSTPTPPISSLFTLGGPQTLRGFQFGGVGPQGEGCAMGMNSYWTTGLHFWTPLPFHSFLGRFGNNFKTHFFYNFGNCNAFTMNGVRSAVGVGMALRLGERARIEYNYCWPIDKQKSDRSQPGFQFGIGYEFI